MPNGRRPALTCRPGCRRFVTHVTPCPDGRGRCDRPLAIWWAGGRGALPPAQRAELRIRGGVRTSQQLCWLATDNASYAKKSHVLPLPAHCFAGASGVLGTVRLRLGVFPFSDTLQRTHNTAALLAPSGVMWSPGDAKGQEKQLRISNVESQEATVLGSWVQDWGKGLQDTPTHPHSKGSDGRGEHRRRECVLT